MEVNGFRQQFGYYVEKTFIASKQGSWFELVISWSWAGPNPAGTQRHKTLIFG